MANLMYTSSKGTSLVWVAAIVLYAGTGCFFMMGRYSMQPERTGK